MKTCVRIGSLVIALGLAGFLVGCASSGGRTSQRARDFEIVETSTKRTLTSKEMAQLEVMVADYLKKEGATGDGDYYVKVFLTPDKDGVSGEWVVVRYSQPTAYAATGFSLLSSYPDYGYSTYYPRYSFDFYPFWWMGFSSFALSYYDDPFYYYGYGGYYPRSRYAHHGDHRWDRDHDHHRDHRPDGHHDPDRPRDDQPPSGALKPSFKPSSGTAANRWNRTPPSQDLRPGENNYANLPDARQRWHGRDNPGTPALSYTGTPYTPTYRPSPQAVSENASPGEPRSRTFHPRDRGPTDNNRPAQNSSAPNPQIRRGPERTASSSGNRFPLKPSHESRQPEAVRDVPSAPAYTPPAPRSDPVPSYTPPPARSDSSDNSNNTSKESSRDGGRRWH
ncbi:MAG TPA: hypothetical protein VIM71_15230 [Lacunisphaera sp.]